jgi:hypothetical protein
MKRVVRPQRGKVNAGGSVYHDTTTLKALPLRNPLKGDERKKATAEVKVAKAGVFVGFRMRF